MTRSSFFSTSSTVFPGARPVRLLTRNMRIDGNGGLAEGCGLGRHSPLAPDAGRAKGFPTSDVAVVLFDQMRQVDHVFGLCWYKTDGLMYSRTSPPSEHVAQWGAAERYGGFVDANVGGSADRMAIRSWNGLA